MPGYLIKDTTVEERKKIVEESLGNISADCDGCMSGLAEMYQVDKRDSPQVEAQQEEVAGKIEPAVLAEICFEQAGNEDG